MNNNTPPPVTPPSVTPYIMVIGVLILIIVAVFVYFMMFHEPTLEKCSDSFTSDICTRSYCNQTFPTTQSYCDETFPPVVSDCQKNTIIGFPIKPGNELLDFANEIEDEMKPLVHGIMCSIISKVKNEIIINISPSQVFKCSEIKQMMDKTKKLIIDANKDSDFGRFSDKHKIVERIQKKLDVFYENLYKRFCKTEDYKITKDEVKKFLDEFEMHACDKVDKIDVDFLFKQGLNFGPGPEPEPEPGI